MSVRLHVSRIAMAQRLATLVVLATTGCGALASSLSPAAAQQPTATTRPLPSQVQRGPTVTPPAPVVPEPVGVWIDHTGRGAVEIVQCGQGLCGNIIWMKDPNDKKGKPLRDILNEDRTKRGRPICGLQIIGGVQAMRDGSWDRGWIYDPEQGESFDVELRLRSPDVLQVKGYKGLKFLSETFQWRRAATPPMPICPPLAPA